jgi:hypothetical protein
VGALACLGATPTLRGQTQALTLAEVIDLRSQGVSTRQILRSAEQFCISFAITDSVRDRLAAVGADSSLVNGLRVACANRELAVPARPADVLLDDDFSTTGRGGEFALRDRRCTARVGTAGLRLENHARDAVCVIGYPSGMLGDNVRIELSVSGLGASRAGLIVLGFGRDPDVVGQFSFSLTADRRVELCRSNGASCQRLVYRTSVPAVRAGTADDNLMAVEVRGRRITLLVNGETIETYMADRAVSGALSLGFGPNTNVDITRIVARRLSLVAASR